MKAQTRAILFSLYILLFSNIFAQSKVIKTCGMRIRVKTETPDFDGWSMCHAGGGAVLYTFQRMLGMKPKTALWLTIFEGYFYEIYIDGLQNSFPLLDKGDPQGADLKGDPIWTAFGAGFACMLDLLFEKNKTKLGFNGNQLTLAINF